ncbi:MAG: polysaccharide biosynthesis C-terminal domain-containing protein [Flavobacteriales bacterium]|nr:polysaccharide biosynthesis C-terminal domain-containing protein [Flavobacteriales bacterium]
MGIVVRQSIYNSIASYLGVIVGAINTIVLFPNIFSADEFGLTRVITAAATLFSSLGLLATQNTTIKFFPFFKNKEEQHNGFLFFILSVPLIGYLLFLVLAYGFETQLTDYYSKSSNLFGQYFDYIPLVVLYMIYFAVFDAYLTAVLKSVIQSFLKNVIQRVMWAGLILLYYYKVLTFDEFIFYYFNSYAFILLVLVVYTAYLKQLFIWPRFNMFSKARVKEIFIYSFFILLGSSSAMLAGTIDSLMIGALVDQGLAQVAFYSVALYMGVVIHIPYQSVIRIANPILADAFKHEDHHKVERIYKQSSMNLLIIGCLLFLGIWLNADNIFQMLPDEYSQAKYVLLYVCLTKLYDACTGVNGGIIQYSGLFRLMLYFNVFLIVLIIATNYWLIPIMGIEGAALATLISIFTTNTLRMIIIKIKMNMSPFEWRSLLVVLIGGLTYGVVYFIPPIGSFIIDAILRSLIIGGLFIIPVYLLNFSSEFNGVIDKSLKVLKLKK